MNVIHLNHPETILPTAWSVEKLSSTKLVPGAKKVGDPYLSAPVASHGVEGFLFG